MEWIDSLHWEGILIGICTFLIIGLFHPVVVKAEYYWGTRCWWIFRPHRFRTGKSDSAVDPVGSFFILFFLDHQGGLRTARTRAERLVPYESKAEEGI